VNQYGKPKPLGYRRVSSHGYVLVKVGKDHPMAHKTGYAYEHRLIASEEAGRVLTPSEEVHHEDENTQNNAPENLDICRSRAGHKVRHRAKCFGNRLPGEENLLISCGCGCGGALDKFDSCGRPRLYLPGHGKRGKSKKVQESVACACGCGELTDKYDAHGRERTFVNGHNRRRI